MLKPKTIVTYPLQGTGKIVEIFQKKIGGESGYFYVVELDRKNARIIIPVKQAKKVGLRKIISKKEVDKVMKILTSKTEIVQQNWTKRFKDNFLQLKNGSIFKIAAVLKELFTRDREKHLSNIERSLFKKAYEFVVAELSVVKKLEKEEIKKLVNKALKKN